MTVEDIEQLTDWYDAERQDVFYMSLELNHSVTDDWRRMLNDELFGMMDVVTVNVGIHLPCRLRVVYGESLLVLPVSCWLEIVGSFCFTRGFHALDPSQRSRSGSPKVL